MPVVCGRVAEEEPEEHAPNATATTSAAPHPRTDQRGVTPPSSHPAVTRPTTSSLPIGVPSRCGPAFRDAEPDAHEHRVIVDVDPMFRVVRGMAGPPVFDRLEALTLSLRELPGNCVHGPDLDARDLD